MLDPDTGSAAYKIGGGYNGSFLAKIPALEIPEPVGAVLSVLFKVISVGVEALSTIETVLSKHDKSIKKVFRSASKYLNRAGIAISVVDTILDCQAKDIVVVLMPLLVLGILIPLMLGPLGFALITAPWALFAVSLVAGLLADLASGAFKEERCIST